MRALSLLKFFCWSVLRKAFYFQLTSHGQSKAKSRLRQDKKQTNLPKLQNKAQFRPTLTNFTQFRPKSQLWPKVRWKVFDWMHHLDRINLKISFLFQVFQLIRFVFKDLIQWSCQTFHRGSSFDDQTLLGSDVLTSKQPEISFPLELFNSNGCKRRAMMSKLTIYESVFHQQIKSNIWVHFSYLLSPKKWEKTTWMPLRPNLGPSQANTLSIMKSSMTTRALRTSYSSSCLASMVI